MIDDFKNIIKRTKKNDKIKNSADSCVLRMPFVAEKTIFAAQLFTSIFFTRTRLFWDKYERQKIKYPLQERLFFHTVFACHWFMALTLQ